MSCVMLLLFPPFPQNEFFTPHLYTYAPVAAAFFGTRYEKRSDETRHPLSAYRTPDTCLQWNQADMRRTHQIPRGRIPLHCHRNQGDSQLLQTDSIHYTCTTLYHSCYCTGYDCSQYTLQSSKVLEVNPPTVRRSIGTCLNYQRHWKYTFQELYRFFDKPLPWSQYRALWFCIPKGHAPQLSKASEEQLSRETWLWAMPYRDSAFHQRHIARLVRSSLQHLKQDLHTKETSCIILSPKSGLKCFLIGGVPPWLHASIPQATHLNHPGYQKHTLPGTKAIEFIQLATVGIPCTCRLIIKSVSMECMTPGQWLVQGSASLGSCSC